MCLFWCGPALYPIGVQLMVEERRTVNKLVSRRTVLDHNRCGIIKPHKAYLVVRPGSCYS